MKHDEIAQHDDQVTCVLDDEPIASIHDVVLDECERPV